MTTHSPTYPQLPPLTKDGLHTLFEKTYFARLGTINEDGTPHISPVYFKYIDGQIMMATQVRSRKVRNIKRNSQVSILIDVTEPVYQGALVYGEAELDFDDVAGKRTDIFRRFKSEADAIDSAEWLCAKWESVILRVTPARIASFDYSQEWPTG